MYPTMFAALMAASLLAAPASKLPFESSSSAHNALAHPADRLITMANTSAATYQKSESETPGYNLGITIVPSASLANTSQNYYVAASIGGTLYFFNGAQWIPFQADLEPPFASSGPFAPGGVAIDVVDNLNLSQLGAGVSVYAGFGRNLGDLLSRGQYALITTINPPPKTARPYPSIAFGGQALTYLPDAMGNRIPDYSYAGYQRGEQPIPQIPVVATLSPVAGDNTANIQNAINQVAAMPVQPNGFRGAILLQAGTYEVDGQIFLNASGIVLRGSGQDAATGTVLLASGTPRRVILAGGAGSATQSGTTTWHIVDSYLPLGATQLTLSDASGLNVGDDIVIQRPEEQGWIDALGMSAIWSPNPGIRFERKITAISGSQITFDIPMGNPIESQWAAGTVYKYGDSARIENVGVENLRGVGNFTNVGVNGNWLATFFIDLENLKNGWARQVTVDGFGNGISVDGGAKWVTVQDSSYVNPAPSDSDAGAAAFTAAGQLSLIQRCSVVGAHMHPWVSQSHATNNVILKMKVNCSACEAGAHQHWAASLLVDDTSYSTYNPATWGSNGPQAHLIIETGSHGWGAGYSILYNNTSDHLISVQQPAIPYHYNWVMGGQAPDVPNVAQSGTLVNFGTTLNPPSLYLQQLVERLGPAGLANTGN